MINKVSFYTDGNIEIVIGKGMHEFPYHTHNSYMVGAVLEGCAEFCIAGKRTKLYKGECYIVPSDKGISIKPISDFHYITICLKNELSLKIREYESDSYFYSGLGHKLLELVDEFQKHIVDEQYFTNYVLNLFEFHKCSISSKSESTLRAVEYINNCCEREFHLDELAKAVFVSKYHLIRSFKKEMGITPKQYHQQCRIRKLKKLAFEFPQSSITYMLNFSTQSHMNNIFKKYMGITVGTYMSTVGSNEQ